jgi:hypothetical protein
MDLWWEKISQANNSDGIMKVRGNQSIMINVK